MQFALNYSREAAQLLQEGRIRIDRFKCADWPDMIAAASALAPVYVHFPLEAGTANGQRDGLDAVETMAAGTDTPYVNLHLVCRGQELPEWALDSADPDLLQIMTQRILADLEPAIARFGPDRIIVENIPYYGPADEFFRAAAEPAVIRRVVEQSGCGLLLDLSHARIAARHMGIDERQYVSSLPLHRLRELHLTGLQHVHGKLRDHMPLTDEDWLMTEWAMECIAAGQWNRPDLVAFEYGGTGPAFAWRSDASVIAQQVPRLYALVHNECR